jgi:hypothetical protein
MGCLHDDHARVRGLPITLHTARTIAGRLAGQLQCMLSAHAHPSHLCKLVADVLPLRLPPLPGSELAIKSAWSGLATGVFHTLCGPDHLAVSSSSVQSSSQRLQRHAVLAQ